MAPRLSNHICPEIHAIHPSDTWESSFIYSFICKFTNLRGKVEGLETPMDLENALLLREPNPIVTGVLSRFILNLRPQTRNLSEDQISTTVASVLGDYFKTRERTVFWNENLDMNVDPFLTLKGGFFTADWKFKLKILRQLVELQLSHSTDIKAKIDRAWGVNVNKNKKKDPETAPPDPSDPNSQENLQMIPIGQDSERKRYWVVDKSPRIYMSTNPWKTAAKTQSVSSTREEYVATIEKLKGGMPPKGKVKKWTKVEASHQALVVALESRVEIIDAEIARVARARKKVEQHKVLMAQAELRQTRTRRQTRKPDYVYNDAADSEDDGDEYNFQEDEGYEEDYIERDFFDDGAPRRSSRRSNGSVPNGQRRSARSAVVNANGKRGAEQDQWSSWRGERRSTRLGAPKETQLDYMPPSKRARTDESTLSTNSSETGASHLTGDSQLKAKASGAASLKPTEYALEQIAGRKKSKYYFYAVEPIPGAAVEPAMPTTTLETKAGVDGDSMDVDPPANGSVSPPASGSHSTTVDSGVDFSTSPHAKAESLSELDRSMAGSLSPLSP